MRKSLTILKPPRSPWTLAVLVALLAAVAGAAATASLGDVGGHQPQVPALASPGSASEVRTFTASNASGAKGEFKTLATMNVPAGDYVFNGKANIDAELTGDPGLDGAGCFLRVFGADRAEGAITEDEAFAGANAVRLYSATVNTQATATLSDAGTAELECGSLLGDWHAAMVSVIAERVTHLSQTIQP